MFKKNINYILSIFVSLFFVFLPFSASASVYCSMNLSVNQSNRSVGVSTLVQSDIGSDFYDIYLDFGEGGGSQIIGKLDGTLNENRGYFTHTYSSYGDYEIILNSGNCEVREVASFPAPQQTQGCTDSNATNYNPSATVDDGSCTYPYVNLNFVVGNSCGGAISGASVGINQNFGNGTSRTTDGSGFANFGVYSNTNVGWSVSASGFGGTSGTVNSGGGTTLYPSLTPTGGCVSAPTVTISASPTSVSSGGSSTLTWSSTNATSCTASNGWSGSKSTSGSQSTGALVANTTFTLTCSNASGSGSNSATITISGSSLPDLTSSVYLFPTTGYATVAQNFTALISNIGTASTGVGFSNFFQVNSGYNGSGTSYDRTPISVSALSSGALVSIVDSIAFTSAGNKSVRVCADKTSSAGGGVITESDESDSSNCTGWTNVTIGAAPSGYSVTINQSTGGTVRSNDNILNCGSSCYSAYAQNSSVTLQAYPASSYWKFDGWTGDCVGTGICSLIVNGVKNVTALFSLRGFDYSEF
ncbi:MAG: Fibronectin type III domain protein [Parcubacteria bacterium C7867-006]|nr:MAG: Fibronectin type III domain protein [Parcubacteria bacterium C7867-006]